MVLFWATFPISEQVLCPLVLFQRCSIRARYIRPTSRDISQGSEQDIVVQVARP